MSVHERPLVTAANPAVLRRAAELGFDRPIETLVEEAILAGRLEHDRARGSRSWVVLGAGFVAWCHRVGRSPLGTRTGWRLYRVERSVGRSG